MAHISLYKALFYKGFIGRASFRARSFCQRCLGYRLHLSFYSDIRGNMVLHSVLLIGFALQVFTVGFYCRFLLSVFIVGFDCRFSFFGFCCKFV